VPTKPARSPRTQRAPRTRRPGPPAPLRLRRATRRDVPTILALIRGLADYEKLAHVVRATPARLARDGFGRRRTFRVLLAERGRRAVGFALYFFAYSTFLARPTLFLEDLYVVPEERGSGAGKRLLRALAQAAVKAGCGRMDWLVLADNLPAIGFYENLGATLHPGWVPARLKDAALRKLAWGR
jgi:GNAT superfamily N-acetyltransferase